MEGGILTLTELEIPGAATDEQIGHVHHKGYLDKLTQGTLNEKEIRRIGFPWSVELVERSRRSVGGTHNACQAALKDGIGINLAGGTHHAHANFGSGFCLLNDCAIAARVLQVENQVQNVMILDCDVHQGDGTAAIFANDPSVFTFSIHGARNFPFRKFPSDLDLPLEDGSIDRAFLITVLPEIPDRKLALAELGLCLPDVRLPLGAWEGPSPRPVLQALGML